MRKRAKLILEDSTEIEGISFGYNRSSAGEVVFNTGMVGYPESLSDPSYFGQILVFTYPLIGNYGVPPRTRQCGILKYFESEKIQIAGLIVSNYSEIFSHHQAKESLAAWLKKERIVALTDVDTRSLTQRLRQQGTMLGKIVVEKDVSYYDPSANNILPFVSIKKPKKYGQGKLRIVVIDCGVKNNILLELINREVEILRVPSDFSFSDARFKYDGVIISNGPGDPMKAKKTVQEVNWLLQRNIPLLGICLGTQLLALAAGAKTYKLKFGHRSQNQPCRDLENKRCYITSQNHGYAILGKSLSGGFLPWFVNLNDQTIEGIKHKSKPFMGVQFHPEASPGPSDTSFLFDLFLDYVKNHAE